MRNVLSIRLSLAGVALAASIAASSPALAASVRTSEDAADRVRSAGYSLVSRADAVPGAWEVWASKDGIPYEIKLDARDGAVIVASPAEADD